MLKSQNKEKGTVFFKVMGTDPDRPEAETRGNTLIIAKDKFSYQYAEKQYDLQIKGAGTNLSCFLLHPPIDVET